MKQYLGLDLDGLLTSAPCEKEFITYYNNAWKAIMAKMYFQTDNVDMGHKLRPRLVLWGYLSTKDSMNLEETELFDIAQIAVCVELIHKASLLLDDFIDKDTTRHSKTSFYIEYGTERMVMYSLNILSNALEIVNNVFSNKKYNSSFYYVSMKEMITTLKKMSWGVLEELDLNRNSIFDIKKIQKIMGFETSSLITNSILMGYYLTETHNQEAEEVLKHTGKDLGYIFQILNDMEAFFSSKVIDHKGSENNDINRFRKNICMPLLYASLTIQEKNKLNLINFEEKDTIKKLLHKHKIKEILFNEISDIHANIITRLNDNAINFNKVWINYFIEFINSVLVVFKRRID